MKKILLLLLILQSVSALAINRGEDEVEVIKSNVVITITHILAPIDGAVRLLDNPEYYLSVDYGDYTKRSETCYFKAPAEQVDCDNSLVELSRDELESYGREVKLETLNQLEQELSQRRQLASLGDEVSARAVVRLERELSEAKQADYLDFVHVKISLMEEDSPFALPIEIFNRITFATQGEYSGDIGDDLTFETVYSAKELLSGNFKKLIYAYDIASPAKDRVRGFRSRLPRVAISSK